MRRRWSRTSKLLGAIAILAGAAAFIVVRDATARLDQLRPVAGTPTTIVVAATDLTRGTTLTADLLAAKTLPSAFAPPGSFRDARRVEGRILLTDVAEDEPITHTRLSRPGAGPVASLVPAGLRAISIPVDVPEGTIRSGDHVDVLATFGGPHPHTETAAMDVEVLLVPFAGGGDVGGTPAGAFGAAIGTRTGGTGSLVLLVSPDLAERLAFASAFADLSVSIDPVEEVVPTATT